MIDLLLLLILVLGVFTGLRRGFVLQLFHMTGFIVAFIVAALYYSDLSPKLTLWIPYPELSEDSSWAIFLDSLPLENAYYNAVAFAILFFGVKIVMQIIASMLDFVADFPILRSINGILGAVLGFVEIYFMLLIILYIGALLPLPFVQNAIDQSVIAQTIVEHTPYFSQKIKELWFEYVATAFTDFSS
ncbi:membrane protein [Pontibacillus halophilus JSM 076056 = DSM 19796]|uniref:Membrane protein n=1 Tax=Pontibacillus halophilus JSM 076056 = DSM 19796 TaxID=1385510 RepID=A0A0A5GQH1_9BACI|nr:CvpA family protein [Pontibacillus halophilus]KGX93420.1 membrane protein [Pontibacillus halophilus JSM 076056 = DSM 19796]